MSSNIVLNRYSLDDRFGNRYSGPNNSKQPFAPYYASGTPVVRSPPSLGPSGSSTPFNGNLQPTNPQSQSNLPTIHSNAANNTHLPDYAFLMAGVLWSDKIPSGNPTPPLNPGIRPPAAHLFPPLNPDIRPHPSNIAPSAAHLFPPLNPHLRPHPSNITPSGNPTPPLNPDIRPHPSNIIPTPVPTNTRISNTINNVTFQGPAAKTLQFDNVNSCREACIDDNQCDKWSYYPYSNNCQLQYGSPQYIHKFGGATSGEVYTQRNLLK